jgi:glycosyl transferase, family 25
MTQLQTFFDYLNNFFDHIYVITIERAKDRHIRIEKELEGLNYEMFFGKDKQFFSIEELKSANIYDEELAQRHHRYHKSMHAGQIGCAWSHVEVYKDIIAKGYERALILEDDVVIDQRFIFTAIEVLGHLPQDWELLYLGFAEREIPPPNASVKKAIYHVLRSAGLFKYTHKTINHLYPKKVGTHLYEAGYHDCTHAYAIKQVTAKKLLQLQQPISFVADNLLSFAITNELVRGYIMLPKVINQQYQVGVESTSYLNH